MQASICQEALLHKPKKFDFSEKVELLPRKEARK